MTVRKIPINDAPPHFRVIDRRHVSGDGAEAPAESQPRYPSYVEELMARAAEMEKRFEQKKSEMMDEIARTRARLQADMERRIGIEKQKLLLPFLEVLDNLERAVDAAAKGGECERLLEGVQITGALFRSRLQAQGIEAVPVLNQPFDPNTSEAVGIVPVSDPARDGIVAEEVLRGYRMGEQLVRPAQVRVARHGGHGHSAD